MSCWFPFSNQLGSLIKTPFNIPSRFEDCMSLFNQYFFTILSVRGLFNDVSPDSYKTEFIFTEASIYRNIDITKNAKKDETN